METVLLSEQEALDRVKESPLRKILFPETGVDTNASNQSTNGAEGNPEKGD